MTKPKAAKKAKTTASAPMFDTSKSRMWRIPPGGPAHPLKDEIPCLEDLQAYVGGYVESLTRNINGTRMTLLMNEDGLMRELEFNREASRLFGISLVGVVLVWIGDFY